MQIAMVLLLAAATAEDPMLAMVRNTAYARVRKARQVAADPTLVGFTRAKNAEREAPEEIASRDRDWIAGRGELRSALVSNRCASRLRELIADDPLIVEVMLMDAQGALVCASAPTSDYFQGDEPKWQQIFEQRKPVFVDEPAQDESADTWAIQLSVPVLEGDRKIGALTLTLQLAEQNSP